MKWTEIVENPQAIHSLFGATEGFELVDLHQASLATDGPALVLRFDVHAVPIPLPVRWPVGANRTQFVLEASGVSNLLVQGWSAARAGTLTVTKGGDGYVIVFASPACNLSAAVRCLRVSKVSGYISNEGSTFP